jgi:hypothetical protein
LTQCAPGKSELWEKSLVDGREAPVISDDHVRDFRQWSPDGMHLAYARSNFFDQREAQVMVWSGENRREEPVMAPSTRYPLVFDWSPVGQLLLLGQDSDKSRTEIWVVPLAAAPRAETAARKIASKSLRPEHGRTFRQHLGAGQCGSVESRRPIESK